MAKVLRLRKLTGEVSDWVIAEKDTVLKSKSEETIKNQTPKTMPILTEIHFIKWVVRNPSSTLERIHRLASNV